MNSNASNKYVLGLDSALLAFSVLKRLGAGNVGTFDERLKSQKIQYLAQVFGVSPAYHYSLYIHGPYSPSFASDLFTIHAEKHNPDVSDFIADELKEKFSSLSEFVIGKSNRQLELIATAHLFVKGLFYSTEKTASKLKAWKGASEEEIKQTLQALDKIPCLH
ncbi:hypothetical protein KGQ27_02585 [Patescibacteria group bacterium]|nr:hypothetical protein [Patescibacteria group bacterium]MDE1946454.1 hypothetical protein [Patescibacteria group bacterium]MDE2011061.1 hypothetical protein [Patescibacteria group bacterium]MDE2233540.1 hypothetical protein [Patescibacteria group bacterium]